MPNSTVVTDRRTAEAVSVLAQLKEWLLSSDPEIADDETLLFDTLDGEGGNAMDVIRAVIRAHLEAKQNAEAADIRIANLRDRRDRLRRKAEAFREAARGAMDALELTRIPDPEFTAAIGHAQASVVVTDEGLLPDHCVRIKREPDKSAIARMLKAGTQVPGAMLSNGTPTLVIRTR